MLLPVPHSGMPLCSPSPSVRVSSCYRLCNMYSRDAPRRSSRRWRGRRWPCPRRRVRAPGEATGMGGENPTPLRRERVRATRAAVVIGAPPSSTRVLAPQHTQEGMIESDEEAVGYTVSMKCQGVLDRRIGCSMWWRLMHDLVTEVGFVERDQDAIK